MKRTPMPPPSAPLTRGKPMPARAKPMPRSAIRRADRDGQADAAGPGTGAPQQVPKPYRPPRGFTEATRRLIYARDRKSCVRCGVYIPSSPWHGSVQHRRSRGLGGTSLPWVSLPGNGTTACGSGTTGCHGWMESEPDDAGRFGWRIDKNGLLLATAVPVLYAALGEVRLLDDFGGFTVLAHVGDVLADDGFDVGAFMEV